MTAPESAHGVQWDLSDLYAAPTDPRIGADLDAADVAARAFAARYRGTIAVESGPPAAWVVDAVAEFERILERTARVSVYADLVHAADSTPPEHGALVALAQERASAVRQTVLFFELEWLALEDAAARRIIDHPACAHYRHFLSSLRRYQPHVLSEAEEKILEDKANTGARAFSRLFDESLAAMQFEVDRDGSRQVLNESEVLTLLFDPQREVRRAAADGLTRGLQTHQLLLGFVFNTLIHDHAVDDRLRRYPHPMAARHLANEISDETVRALIEACEAQHELVRRYYRLKRRLLGLDALMDYDRHAPVVTDTPAISWSRGRELVLAAYHAFSPRMAAIAEQFFTQRWIDAEPRTGKRGGAFSASTVPSVHPYVLVNYTARVHDVMTVAHELGHGVHQYLSRGQGFLQADTPLTMAETASVFGEMLVFEHLLADVRDPAIRLGLVCQKIEDTIGTVFRQVALTRFEEAVHAARRTDGEVARERLCALWHDANATLYGDAVTLTEGYRWWWAYIPHFVHTPFYCYAYAFGELLVLALYDLYQREGAAFVPRYLALLEAGGSAPPDVLLARVGVDVTDPAFWRAGLTPFAALVDEAERLAATHITPAGLPNQHLDG